jgi:hypothetical protein
LRWSVIWTPTTTTAKAAVPLTARIRAITITGITSFQPSGDGPAIAG